MSIIVKSNQSQVRVRANSKMKGRDPLVVYCTTLPLIALQGYHTTTEDMGSLV